MVSAVDHHRPIETIHGLIQGRDAVHFDRLEQDYAPGSVRLYGEIRTTLMTRSLGLQGKWIKYELAFDLVYANRGWELEVYPVEKALESSFDRVENSSWVEELGLDEHHHYVLATYDYVFEFLARDYVLKFGAVRS